MMAHQGRPAILAAIEQSRGSNPARSAFVAASAGSGKTKVLRDRVLRLLLQSNIDPRRILCLTFTKAAAAEMATRIALTLSRWAAMPESALRREILDLIGDIDCDDALIAQARRLFARVLDTPGGMRIHTIHAFCQSLLRRFPLEAGIAPHFQLIEDRDANQLMDQARNGMLAAAHSGLRADLTEALTHIVGRLSEGQVSAVLRSLQANKSDILALLRGQGGFDAAIRAIAAELGVDPQESAQDEILRASTIDAHAAADLRRAALALSQSGKTYASRGNVLADWLAAPAHMRAQMFEEYLGVFFTDKGERRKQLAAKAAEKLMADIHDVMAREADRLVGVIERVRALDNLADTRAILRLGLDAAQRYEALKSHAARLDYDDLIRAAMELLGRPGIAPWILYKLDGGIDHVLIDEAQDTSPQQWRLIVDLTAEFFAGIGAVERPRTLFAVGDSKQSIFSFQGADPKLFRLHLEHFRKLDPHNFEEVSLDVSFRSSAAILTLVDRVFEGGARAGVVDGADTVAHVCSRAADFGDVRLWPLAVPLETKEPEPWRLPEIVDQGSDPQARLADRIAAEIQDLIGRATTKQSTGVRLIEPGDILVLVRNRTQIVELLVRRLKERSIPVAGVDRMNLLKQVAVQDLMALGEFLLQRKDDLNLAALLRSPLLNLSEENLFDLCAARPGRLWASLRQKSGSCDWADRAHAYLSVYLEKFRRLTPHELFADLLGHGEGRKRFYARLGPQCGEAIDEFLGLALAYEKNHAPSMQGFLAWLRSGETIVKRDLDAPAGQVRIMTVHGSKGLQAPIVFLCDQRRRPSAASGLFWFNLGDRRLPLWSANQMQDSRLAATLRQQELALDIEEENRLLYVAMTRAEERLYVCGWKGGQNIQGKSWHDRVSEAFDALAASGRGVLPIDFGGEPGWDGAGRRFALGEPAIVEVKTDAKVDDFSRPQWLHTKASDEIPAATPSTPSGLIGKEPGALLSPLGVDQGWRYKRGALIHHLLELLPSVERDRRETAARSFLSRPTHALSGSEVEEIILTTLAVLHDPAFDRLFGPGSIAEAPIVAECPGFDGVKRQMSGRIDRLWVGESEVWVIDYKSNRPAPLHPAHISSEYQVQMSSYRLALSYLYPNKGIRCFLLWTDGPKLMEVPADMLETHDKSTAKSAPLTPKGGDP